MTTYTASTTHGDIESYAFRSLNALARRLGGTDWEMEHEAMPSQPDRTVMILRNGGRGEARTVVTRVRVPREAIEAAAEPQPPGRPGVGDVVNVRLTAEQISDLNHYCHEHQISRAEAIRQAVDRLTSARDE